MEDDRDFQSFQYVISSFDAPAFVRRGRDVAWAWESLLVKCDQKREELIQFPRLRLAQLFAVTSSCPSLLTDLCTSDDFQYLEGLNRDWALRLRVPIAPTKSARVVKQALAELVTSFERFNCRWSEYLQKIDLSNVNALRAAYNEKYLLEKECATWSIAATNRGFAALPPVSIQDLQPRFPLLTVPGKSHTLETSP